MSAHSRSRTAIALMLSLIAALSAAQTAGVMPSLVSAHTPSIPLTLAPGSTDPPAASGTVEVDDSGQLIIQLHQATFNSTYQAVFASGSGNVQLGNLTTDKHGEGQLQASLSPGSYSGIFELLRTGAIQFVSKSIPFNIGASATTQSSTETQSESDQVNFTVDPSFASVSAGDIAKFEIQIIAHTNEQILLRLENLPRTMKSWFSLNPGTADPEFHSTMTILTSRNTSPDTYGLTVVAIVNRGGVGQEYDSQVALDVTASSTMTSTEATSASTTASANLRLSITLTSTQPVYQPNSTVNLQGYVTDSSGSAAPNANVVVQVDGPFGVEVSSSGGITTDAAGTFQDSFQLPPNGAVGTYTAFASTSKAGFDSATTHTTFVVGQSTTPSVNIQMVYVGDSSGNPTTTFTAGSQVYVWVTVQNTGATFQGVLWVQINDPNGIPVSIQIHISTLNTGETVKDGFGFTLLSQPTPGLYTVNALVSDKLISQGGTFLTSANTEFAVTD